MRLILDIAKTCEGRYEGRLTIPGTGAQHDFAGILELLAILEEQLGPDDTRASRAWERRDLDRITDEHGWS